MRYGGMAIGIPMALIGLGLAIGLAFFHPDAQGSIGIKVIMILAGIMFISAGLLFAFKNTPWENKAKKGLSLALMLAFAALLLTAPWISKDGTPVAPTWIHVVVRLVVAIIPGIMALLLLRGAYRILRQEKIEAEERKRKELLESGEVEQLRKKGEGDV